MRLFSGSQIRCRLPFAAPCVGWLYLYPELQPAFALFSLARLSVRIRKAEDFLICGLSLHGILTKLMGKPVGSK